MYFAANGLRDMCNVSTLEFSSHFIEVSLSATDDAGITVRAERCDVVPVFQESQSG